jgi:HprK-related kinase A
MLTVASVPPAQLRARLASTGLRLRTGEFVTCVRSAIPHVADGIALMYGDYPLAGDDSFTDFYLSLSRSSGVRRWWRPQVQLDHDGAEPFTPLPLNQAFAMMEWAMNWCVTSRVQSCLVIHAAVIEKNGRAAILPAPPGSGKSTLCAALIHRGWRLLSDELTLVRLDSGEVMGLARPVSLKNASIEVIRNWAPNAVFTQPVRDTAKGTVAHMKAPADSIARAGEPARPAWVVFPRYVTGAAPELTPIPKARAFLRVAENAFNYSQLGEAGFHAVAKLIDRSASYDFHYSRLEDAVAVFDQLAAAAP